MSDRPASNPTAVIDPKDVPPRRTSSYPDAFKRVVAGREKRALGEAGGLRNFGVNLTPTRAWSRIRSSALA